MGFAAKAIIPKKMRLNPFEKFLLARMEGFADGVINNSFQLTSLTWKKEKPAYGRISKKKKKELSVTVGVLKDTKGNRKWIWLNGGTSLRWALMSSDWKSKTKPRRLKSGRGQGRVVIVGRRAMQARGIRPRPGIKERGWIDIIEKKTSKPFKSLMTLAIREYDLYG